MPKTQDINKLLTDNLGKPAAKAMVAKINLMAKQGAKATAIEKAVIADLQNHIQEQVAAAVIAKVGPIQPIKVKSIQVAVKPIVVKPITVSPKINTGVSVKVGPGPIVKGTR